MIDAVKGITSQVQKLSDDLKQGACTPSEARGQIAAAQRTIDFKLLSAKRQTGIATAQLEKGTTNEDPRVPGIVLNPAIQTAFDAFAATVQRTNQLIDAQSVPAPLASSVIAPAPDAAPAPINNRCTRITSALMGPAISTSFAWYTQSLTPVYFFVGSQVIRWIVPKLFPTPAPQPVAAPANAPVNASAAPILAQRPQDEPVIPAPQIAAPAVPVSQPIIVASAPVTSSTLFKPKHAAARRPTQRKAFTNPKDDMKEGRPAPVAAVSSSVEAPQSVLPQGGFLRSPASPVVITSLPQPVAARKPPVGAFVLPGLGNMPQLKSLKPIPAALPSLLPGDVVASTNQYKLLGKRGKVACTPIAMNWLSTMIANKNKMTSKQLDDCIRNGIMQYGEKFLAAHPEKNFAWKTNLVSDSDLNPLDWGDVQGSILKKDCNFKKCDNLYRPALNEAAIKDKDFNALFADLMKQDGISYAGLVLSGGGAVAQTFGIAFDKAKQTFYFFNSHGTDGSRNDLDGREDAPARMSCFANDLPAFKAHLAEVFRSVSSREPTLSAEVWTLPQAK